MRLLVVDDDRKLCQLIKDVPRAARLPRSNSCTTGSMASTAPASGEFGAVILDVMMPGLDGFEALKETAKRSEVPVLMLTSRGDEADRIVGLEIGADDYLPKTFSTRELLARLRAVTRRTPPRTSGRGRG